MDLAEGLQGSLLEGSHVRAKVVVGDLRPTQFWRSLELFRQ
jgi:hypothetical protein